MLGSFPIQQAFLEGNKEILKIPADQRRGKADIEAITNFFASLAENAKTEAKEMGAIGIIKMHRVRLRGGAEFRVRIHADISPEVAKLWREAETGRAKSGSTYVVWSSDGECGGRGMESKVERKILKTLTSLEDARESAKGVRGEKHGEGSEVSESGMPIGKLGRPEMAGDDVGVMMGWEVMADMRWCHRGPSKSCDI
jgi:hypothetical protein